jgi:hypothetical protein
MRLQSSSELVLLSGRAPDPEYKAQVQKLLGSKVTLHDCTLKDHASRGEMLETLARFPQETIFAVGYKEAVKLCSPQELLQAKDSFVSSSGHTFYVLDLALRFEDSESVLREILHKVESFR